MAEIWEQNTSGFMFDPNGKAMISDGRGGNRGYAGFNKRQFTDWLTQIGRGTTNPYLVRTLDLGTTRTDFPIPFAGHSLYFKEFTLGAVQTLINRPVLNVKFNRIENDLYPLYPGERIDSVYNRVYLSWAAMIGCTATLVFQRDMNFQIENFRDEMIAVIAASNYIENKAVQVATAAATELWAPSVVVRNPSLIIIQNLGPNPIFYGLNAVTILNGIQIPPGAKDFLDNAAILNTIIALYAIAATALQVAPADTRTFRCGVANNLRYR